MAHRVTAGRVSARVSLNVKLMLQQSSPCADVGWRWLAWLRCRFLPWSRCAPAAPLTSAARSPRQICTG